MSRPLTFNVFYTSALVNDTVNDIANYVQNTMGSECEGLWSNMLVLLMQLIHIIDQTHTLKRNMVWCGQGLFSLVIALTSVEIQQ